MKVALCPGTCAILEAIGTPYLSRNSISYPLLPLVPVCLSLQRAQSSRNGVVASFNTDVDFEYTIENGQSSFLTPPRPNPVQFPRKSLNLKFAVLLMRSAYQACDDLDFIAMDKFQAKFWKLRQSEVEPYTLQYSPIKVRAGELTDPLYFDFINFSQFAAISEAMRTGETVFQERNGAFGDLVTVIRDPTLRDNSLLPKKFKSVVGSKVYDGLVNGFEDVTFGAPSPCPGNSPLDCAINSINSILQIMVGQGYALTAAIQVSNRPISGGICQFKVILRGPANLWGIRELASRQSLALNDYEAMVIGAFLTESGYSWKYKSKLADTFVEHVFSISQIERSSVSV